MIWILGVIALILCLLIGYIVVVRVARPHSKRMGRNGAPQSAPTPTGAGAPVPAAATKGKFAWVGEYLWTILLVIAGLVIFIQGGIFSSEWQSPSFAQVGSWSWAHWLQLLVLCGIGLALLKLHSKRLGAAEPVLRSTLIAAAVIAFLVCPAIGWLQGIRTSQSATSAQTICPDVSAYQTRSCVMTYEWSNDIKFADGPEANGKNFCTFPLMKYERRDADGTTFWRFKTDGRAEMKYRLFPAGEKCPDVL